MGKIALFFCIRVSSLYDKNGQLLAFLLQDVDVVVFSVVAVVAVLIVVVVLFSS